MHVQKERHLRLTSDFKSFNICFSRGLNVCMEAKFETHVHACSYVWDCIRALKLYYLITELSCNNKADQTETEIKARVHPGQIMFIHSTPRWL